MRNRKQSHPMDIPRKIERSSDTAPYVGQYRDRPLFFPAPFMEVPARHANRWPSQKPIMPLITREEFEARRRHLDAVLFGARSQQPVTAHEENSDQQGSKPSASI